MLVICYGQPKSASSFVHKITNNLIEEAGFDQAATRAKCLGDISVPYAPHPYFVEFKEGDVRKIVARMDATDVLVLKCHGNYLGEVGDLVKAGQVKVIYSYREPRDCVLSLWDACAIEKSKPNEFKRLFFTKIKNIEECINIVENQLTMLNPWLDLEYSLGFSFDYISTGCNELAAQICMYLGLDTGIARPVCAGIQQNLSAVPEFNIGKAGRYKTVFSESQLALCDERFLPIEKKIRSKIELSTKISLENRIAEIRNSQGEILYLQGRLEEAERKFIHALEVEKNFVLAHNNLAVLYWQAGDVENCLRYITSALELDSDHPNVIHNTSRILAALGQVNEAEAILRQYLGRVPDDLEAGDLLKAISSENSCSQGDDPSSAESTSGGDGLTIVDYRLPVNAVAAPLISIVVPSCNQAGHLEECIESILSQEYPNLELIVMDRGSTDGSVDIIKKYSGRISYWQSQPDEGPYWAIDKGIQYSHGDIITWLNSDDILRRDSLNSVASVFSQCLDVEWLTGIPNAIDKDGHAKWTFLQTPVYCHDNYLGKCYDYPCYIQQGGTFWRRSVWVRGGRSLQTELKMAGDLELWARFFRYTPLYTLDAKTASCRQYAGQMTADTRLLYHQEAKEVLEREIRLFTHSGTTPISPVAPLRLEKITCFPDKVNAKQPALEDESLDASALNRAGEQAFADGDLQRAERCFQRAMNLEPNNVEIYNNLMVLYWGQGDAGKAVDFLASAVERDPTYRNVIINGGQILVALNQLSEARELFRNFLKNKPGDEEIAELLASTSIDSKGGGTVGNTNNVPQKHNAAGECIRVTQSDYTDECYSRNAPRISIVIPSFNQGEYLEQTICSVLEQGYPDLELVIMDGGSTDGSAEIIEKYEDRLTYWQSQKDKGQYWAINEGLKRTSGEIMAWINSDDKFHPGSFNAVASIFDQLEDIDWVTGTPNIMNENGELAWVCSPPPVYSRKYYLAKKYDYPNYIQQEGTFWRRSLWEKAGGRLKTSLKMAGDLELWMRFFRHSRLYTTDMLLGCFRQHGGQKTAGNLELYRTEALSELGREITRFKKSNHTLPEDAPIIMIADEAMLFRKSEGGESETRQASGCDDDILVTAIVSTYNSEQYIRGCLEDLEAQTIADKIEIVVVDSGSEQNERAIVEEFQQRHPNIIYIRTDDRETIYSAWNRGVAAARGEYLTNANTDDRHLPVAYERMVSELEANPDVALVYADSAVTRVDNSTFEAASIDAYFRWPEFNARKLFSNCYIGPQPMWRRSLHDKYGLFDSRMQVAGDYEFWLRLAVSETFRHIPEVLGLYLKSPDSLEHAFSESAAMESELVRRRNWPVEWGARPEPGRSNLVSASEINGGDDDQCKPAPLVSIIMPTKNRVELLGRALDSVIAQTYKHWELIVVNDGDDDVTPVVDSRASWGRIHCIVLDQSVGQAAARNIALQEANGQIICYLDDDDIYLAHHLETVVTALSREGRPFVYTDAVLVPERHNNGIPQDVGERSNPYQHDEYSRDRLLVNNYIPINTWAHWKTCLDEVGVLDESLNCYEDWEFLLRLSARYEFTHIRQTTVEVMFRVDRVDNVTRQRLTDTADAYRVIYRRHGDNLPEGLVHARTMKLQALECDAENCRQADQSLFDATDSDAGERGGNGGSTGFIPDEQRLQYLRDQFLHRVEESGYVLPSIHLIMVADENNVVKIADTIDSLGRQVYACWGLSVISAMPSPHQDFDALPMLEWIQSEDVGQSFVDAARQSDCDWVASVMPGDTLEAEALSVFVDYINRNPCWKFIYSDEDCVDASGKQVNHKFKPDINPDYLRSCPYTGNLSLVHRDLLEQLSSDIGIPAASFYDLALKVLESHGVSAIGHIPTQLYHQLQDNERREARDTWVKPVLEAYVRRNDIDARVLTGTAAGTCMIDYRCSGAPEVCIAIYVGSDLARVERTVASLLNKTVYSNWTIRLGVDTALAPLFNKYQSEQLSVDSLDRNASRCSYFNGLAQTVDADYMVFMDSGVVVLQENWLERLLAQGQRPEIGVVGIRLVSPQNRIVHTGILTGIGSFGVGGYSGEGDTLEQEGYMQRSQVVQNLSAVSSACMLIKRSLYKLLQGFDAGIAVQLYRDVDFCLRVSEAGKRVVWTPFVTMLVSDDSLDIYTGEGGNSRVEQDSRQVTSKWLGSLARDPAYNRNLTLKRADFSGETGLKPAWDPTIRDLPRIIGGGAGSYSSWAYRVAQPLDALSAAGKASYSHIPFKGDSVEHLPSIVEMERIQPDVLLMHNTVHDHFLDALRQYKEKNNIFLMFGQDDLMFAVPPKSSCFKLGYKDIKKRVRTCLSLADRLVVTSESLADELSGFISDVRIVPNHLDARIWDALESRRGCGLKPRVGWAGAMQHHGDLEVLADAVRETADEVDWIFMGMCPEFLRPYVKEVHEYVAFSAYPETLAKLNLDLAVAPLERNRFNRCKSNLRILEYGAMGWPVIASDIEPYREAPVHLVSNQTRAWVNAIREHIHDLDTNWKAGDTLQEWVRENCLLQQHVDDWLDALDPSDGSHCQALASGKASGL